MDDKPTAMDGYPPELAEEARRMALHIATILGDRDDPHLRQDAVGAVRGFLAQVVSLAAESGSGE